MACYHPVVIKSPLNDKAYIQVPCGKCAGCRRNLQNQWYLRFIEENKEMNCRFVTLTYNDENIPKSVDSDGCIHYNVDKSELQRFFKRMRKSNKFKYFAVSEYGTQTMRPHYHLLLFSNDNINIGKYWRCGFVVDLPANKGSFRYVTKYLLKGSNVPQGSENNFMICSKRPAIGKSYVDKLKIDLVDYKMENPIMRDHEVVYSLPRYYRKKLYEKLPDNGENMKRFIVEDLESEVYHPMYKIFLEDHDSDEDFYKWLNSIEKTAEKKQVQIKRDSKL